MTTQPADEATTDLSAVLAEHFPHLHDVWLSHLAEALAPYVRQQRAAALAPFEALFSGGPDTVCRTTWRVGTISTAGSYPERIECVEVPMSDLREAFARAEAERRGEPA